MGDFEKLLGLLRRARVPVTLDSKELSWIRVPGAVFHFSNTGRRLIGVVKSETNGGRKA